MTQINYEQSAWMQPVTDKDGGTYFVLGKVTNAGFKNTLAVTPAHGKGETKFFCEIHREAYGLHGVCIGCRLQSRDEVQEVSVTTCDTP